MNKTERRALRVVLAAPENAGIVRVTTGSQPVIRSRTLQPLSTTEWSQTERVAARLHAEFRSLIASLPTGARHASGMARELGVLRVTCQRLVSALQDPHPSISILGRLPGVEALQQLLAGFERAKADREYLDAAHAAVEDFEALIRQQAGSLSKLNERLKLGAQDASSSVSGSEASPFSLADLSHREDLFHTSVNVTGRACATSLSIYAFREISAESVLERGTVKGSIGNLLFPGGMPMVLSSGEMLKVHQDGRRLQTLSHDALKGRTPEAILASFTTDPLPAVTSRQRCGTLLQVVDAHSAAGQPFDLITAFRGRSPIYDAHGNPTLETVWSLINAPTQKLIMDVWLHQDMERKYLPNIDCQLWNPGLLASADERWTILLPSQPKLQLLGRGLGHTRTDFYSRHPELTAHFFSQMGWNPEEFVGFRCEVEYPIWRAGYCMAFDPVSTSIPSE